MSPVMKKVAGVYQTLVLLALLILLPIGSAVAETVPEETTEEHPTVASPMAEYFTGETKQPPRFFFQQSRMTVIVNEPLSITILSDQEVEEVRIKLPNEAQLQTNGLPTGMTAHKEDASQEWVLRVPRAQATFVFPVVFEETGECSISVGETTATIVVEEPLISNKESIISANNENFEFVDEENLLYIEQQIDNQFSLDEILNEENRPDISFVVDTFSAEKGQQIEFQIIVQGNQYEFSFRMPPEATINLDSLDETISVEHSHGDYWTIYLASNKQLIALPIVFSDIGSYFISVDDDNAHMFIDITTESANAKKSIKTFQDADLLLPTEMIQEEEGRIFENTLDESNRNTTSVSNWSQFRSAWNNNSTQAIFLNNNINFSSSILGNNLDTRSGFMAIYGRGQTLNVGSSGNQLAMNGNTLHIHQNTTIVSENSGTLPLISITGGRGILNVGSATSATIINRRGSAAISAASSASIIIWGGSQVVTIFNTQAISPISLTSSSSLSISGNARVGSNAASSTFRPPITTSANARVNIDASNVMMGGRINATTAGVVSHLTTYRVPWNSVNATLTGVNASIVSSSTSDPNDFSVRYLQNHNSLDYRSLTTGAGASDGFVPPVSTYTLSLQASPVEGGNPHSDSITLSQGSSTTIIANPNPGYEFLRWEIVSGRGTFTNSTAENTSFRIDNADTVIRAVYERRKGAMVVVEYVDESLTEIADSVQLNGYYGDTYEAVAKEIEGYSLIEIPKNATGVFTDQEQNVIYRYSRDDIEIPHPVDPLDPESEVDPENKPDLPEDQGLLSIDFVSAFTFASQVVSVQEQVYYAQPQRLLNTDGTVSATEERPNYVQISDRRPEESRHGWQLAVRQNGQFETANGEELQGASLGLTNQQLATAQGGAEPSLQQSNPLALIPNNRRVLLMAQGTEGTGTWIYRFGDGDTASESVSLTVPKGATPSATTYRTTLTWELAAVPENE